MLESFVNFKEVNQRPWLAFIWALVICSVAILVSIQLSFHINVSQVSVNLTGIFAVLFTVIPSVYFMTMLIKREEAMEEEYIKKHYHETEFWERHVKDLMIFLFYFAGVTLAFSVWTMLLPGDSFIVQVAKINQIHGLSGAASATGFAASPLADMSAVFYNNMQVLFFSFLFGFIFCGGAVFIIVWNASILGVYIGRLAESLLHIPGISALFIAHGVPEIGGYIAAALAGGLISVAIVRRHGQDVISRVILDAILVLMFALFSVFCGAMIEATAGIYFWLFLTVWWGTFIYMLLRFLMKL